jgi:hypothetical protein
VGGRFMDKMENMKVAGIKKISPVAVPSPRAWGLRRQSLIFGILLLRSMRKERSILPRQ